MRHLIEELAFLMLVSLLIYGKTQDVDYSNDIEEPLGLSSGATELLGKIALTFSCENRIYGYYADVDNNCQIFHVCHPVEYPNGRKRTFQFSFFCGNGTVFDQSLLTCVHKLDAIPCEESTDYYALNEEFGKIPPPK